jgi:hypothetical protein
MLQWRAPPAGSCNPAPANLSGRSFALILGYAPTNGVRVDAVVPLPALFSRGCLPCHFSRFTVKGFPGGTRKSFPGRSSSFTATPVRERRFRADGIACITGSPAEPGTPPIAVRERNYTR